MADGLDLQSDFLDAIGVRRCDQQACLRVRKLLTYSVAIDVQNRVPPGDSEIAPDDAAARSMAIA